jgi:hypothetical protein
MAMFMTGPGKCNDGTSNTLTVTILDNVEGSKNPPDTISVVSTDFRFSTGGTLPLMTGNYQVHDIIPLTASASSCFTRKMVARGTDSLLVMLDFRHAQSFAGYATISTIGEGMPISSVIPSPILETLKDSEETLRTTLAELAQDKRKQKPNISERKLAEYLADQMGYRGARNVEALVASRERIAKSRQAVGLGK